MLALRDGSFLNQNVLSPQRYHGLLFTCPPRPDPGSGCTFLFAVATKSSIPSHFIPFQIYIYIYISLPCTNSVLQNQEAGWGAGTFPMKFQKDLINSICFYYSQPLSTGMLNVYKYYTILSQSNVLWNPCSRKLMAVSALDNTIPEVTRPKLNMF